MLFSTERLALKKFTLEDAPFILTLLNDPTFLEQIGDKGIRDFEGARRHVSEQIISSYETRGYGAYLVCLKANNTPIGLCGFFKRDQFDFPDIGYAFLPEFTGKGYAFEATKATLGFGKSEFNFTQILAFTSPNNTRSANLLNRIGLHLKETVRYGEKQEMVHLYAIEF